MSDKEIVVAGKDNPVDKFVQYKENREKILEFVKDELQQGIDYGKMYGGAQKDSLLKPGAEKVCVLLRIEPVFCADLDSWTMLGSKEGYVNYVCYLMTPERKFEALTKLKEMGIEYKNEIYKMLCIAEGRGAGYVEEKKTTNDNSLVKIVEKRALVDAVLRVAGLSEIFTQDGEDPEIADGEERARQETKLTKPAKSNTYLEIEQQIIDYLNSPSFTGKLVFEGKEYDLDEFKNDRIARLNNKVYYMKDLKKMRDAIKRMAELAEIRQPEDVEKELNDDELFDINTLANQEGNLSE